MDGRFQYTPLNQPDEQIRLLSILPGPPDSPLECTLTVASLKPHPPPPYIAISYTWGPPTPTTTITINGQPTIVRHSCHNALRTMRLHHPNVPIWIDALCINQTDTHEKNHQVALMGTIYHAAASVAACLQQCDDSLATMRNLYPLLLPQNNTRNPNSQDDAENENNEIFEHWQTATHTLLQNAYFTRLWIVQEIGLARTIRLYAGADVLSWTELETQAYDWRGRMLARGRYPVGDDVERALKELADTRTAMGTHEVYGHQGEGKGGQTLTLTGLVAGHLGRGCENPRDRLYAMLPMLEHAAAAAAAAAGGVGALEHGVRPDYGRSEWEVLWEYVKGIRFPVDPEKRRNSIVTGFELWTGLKTFEGLAGCFRVSVDEIAAFFEARRAQGRQPPFSDRLNPLETHFVGYAMRLGCINSSAYAALIRDNDVLSRIPPLRRHFLAVWPGLPTAVFTVGSGRVYNDPEALSIEGYYPCHGPVQALQRLPERCGCRDPSCPAKRSKRDIYVHPEDLLAMVLLTQRPPGTAIDYFTTAHTRSFVRMWEPQQTAREPPSHITPGRVSVATMFAGLRRSVGRRL